MNILAMNTKLRKNKLLKLMTDDATNHEDETHKSNELSNESKE